MYIYEQQTGRNPKIGSDLIITWRRTLNNAGGCITCFRYASFYWQMYRHKIRAGRRDTVITASHLATSFLGRTICPITHTFIRLTWQGRIGGRRLDDGSYQIFTVSVGVRIIRYQDVFLWKYCTQQHRIINCVQKRNKSLVSRLKSMNKNKITADTA